MLAGLPPVPNTCPAPGDENLPCGLSVRLGHHPRVLTGHPSGVTAAPTDL
jgi:hypothetical protein